MEIKGREIFKIGVISTGNSYKAEEGSRLHGKKYNLYQYLGTAFTVPQDSEFVQWRDKGQLYSVDFTEGQREVEDPNNQGVMIKVKSLQFTSCTSITQEKAMAEVESDLEYIKRKHDPARVTDAMLNAAANAV